MYYEPGRTAHGLAFDPFKSCVVPRPIGWISTVSKGGVANLAPFSQFTNLSFDPPMVMFSANQKTTGERKDTVVNAEETGEFVWNMATWNLREAVNISAQEVGSDVDEFAHAGLDRLPSSKMNPFRVAASPVHFECRYIQTTRLPGNGVMGTVDVVFGRVEAVHIADEFILPTGKIDILKIRPIARMGYSDYAPVESLFEMQIPGSDSMGVGLSGDVRRHAAMSAAEI